MAQGIQYFKDNARGLLSAPFESDEPDGQLSRRNFKLNFSLLPLSVKNAYQAGQRDFTFTKEQVLAYLGNHSG